MGCGLRNAALGVVLLQLVCADLPVHCLHKDVMGDWMFTLGENTAPGPESETGTSVSPMAKSVPEVCGFPVPDAPGGHDKLRPAANPPDGNGKENMPNFKASGKTVTVGMGHNWEVVGKNGTVRMPGLWTMIYDEAFHIAMNDPTDDLEFDFTAFNWHTAPNPDESNAVENAKHTDCKTTLIGWYKKRNSTTGDVKESGCWYGKQTAGHTGDATPKTMTSSGASTHDLRHRVLPSRTRATTQTKPATAPSSSLTPATVTKNAGDTGTSNVVQLTPIKAGGGGHKTIQIDIKVDVNLANNKASFGGTAYTTKTGTLTEVGSSNDVLGDNKCQFKDGDKSKQIGIKDCKTMDGCKWDLKTNEKGGGACMPEKGQDEDYVFKGLNEEQVAQLAKKPLFGFSPEDTVDAILDFSEDKTTPTDMLGPKTIAVREGYEAGGHEVPDFDWRTVTIGKSTGFVPKARNQGGCGSCYAVASSTMLTARTMIKYPKLAAKDGDDTWKGKGKEIDGEDDVSISWRHLLNCNWYNQGCKGGYPYLVMLYAKDHFVPTSKCFPQNTEEHKADKCSDDCDQKIKLNNWGYIGGAYGRCGAFGSCEPAMREELYRAGPIVVAIEPQGGFSVGTNGVVMCGTGTEGSKEVQRVEHKDDCPENNAHGVGNETHVCYAWRKVDHSVAAIGWGVMEGKKYWILQNSWGSTWNGDGHHDGHIKLERGTNCMEVESIPIAADPVLYEDGKAVKSTSMQPIGKTATKGIPTTAATVAAGGQIGVTTAAKPQALLELEQESNVVRTRPVLARPIK